MLLPFNTALGLVAGFVGLVVGLATMLLIWRHRASPAGQLLPGAVIIVGGLMISLFPSFGAYAVDVLASALASLLFARSILQEQLFGPLTWLNAELAASNAQLRVLSAGLRMTADELRRSRDAAEAASLAKSQFLATMSHELRTLLIAILGYSDLMRIQLEREGTVQAEDIKVIAQAGSHLLALINDVLDLTRVEAQQVPLDLTRVALAPLLAEVADALQPLVAKGGNRLRIQCQPEAGAILSDGVRLRQILLNLLSNAVKFTHGGSITLAVAREQADDGEILRFTVADTGIGMTPEQVAGLFQPFMQADTTATRKYGGAGLGLALSQRLCQLLGGTIAVASEPGAGSTFTVTLPARHPAAGSAQQLGA
jgi:signal transduction histidine kinase